MKSSDFISTVQQIYQAAQQLMVCPSSTTGTVIFLFPCLLSSQLFTYEGLLVHSQDQGVRFYTFSRYGIPTDQEPL